MWSAAATARAAEQQQRYWLSAGLLVEAGVSGQAPSARKAFEAVSASCNTMRLRLPGWPVLRVWRLHAPHSVCLLRVADLSCPQLRVLSATPCPVRISVPAWHHVSIAEPDA